MFSVHCPRHRRAVLLDSSNILGLGPVLPEGGLAILYRCTCGYEGQWPPAPCAEEEWNHPMAG